MFGLSSGAALATVVGILIEAPLMPGLVDFCKRIARLVSILNSTIHIKQPMKTRRNIPSRNLIILGIIGLMINIGRVEASDNSQCHYVIGNWPLISL